MGNGRWQTEHTSFNLIAIRPTSVHRLPFTIYHLPFPMPKPEIARRCHSCGVSIRVRASFCSQCGKALTPKPDAAKEADGEALTLLSGTPELTAETSGSAATQPLNSEETELPRTAALTSPATPRKQPKRATVGMVHTAGSLPREVIGEDGSKRVEKFRQISSAVIDEAAYDPSLRFVLVAAVLFILFLFLLLLSELIT
ncbi:hypothetical protein BH18ACI4_BH18ACI4_24210 [soil metagenome]